MMRGIGIGGSALFCLPRKMNVCRTIDISDDDVHADLFNGESKKKSMMHDRYYTRATK
jgi:hypothetical protein